MLQYVCESGLNAMQVACDYGHLLIPLYICIYIFYIDAGTYKKSTIINVVAKQNEIFCGITFQSRMVWYNKILKESF